MIRLDQEAEEFVKDGLKVEIKKVVVKKANKIK